MATGGVSGHLFCFGYGYTARALAEALRADGWTVAGTTRSEDKRRALEREGIEAHRFDRGRPLADARNTLARATHVVTSIPPDEAGDPVLAHHLGDLVAAPKLGWIGYLGTTGVYGDRDGDWVDESDRPDPTLPRTRRRVAAEGGWLASGLPVHLFRLAGIYGPGRSALESLKNGTARRIVKPGQVFGRIHLEDIVQVLLASIARPNPCAIYNVADDEPAPPQDVVTFAAELLGCEPPPEIPYDSAGLSPMARTFYADNRRIANHRIKEELGVELRFPNYRDGLRALLSSTTVRD